MWPGDHLTSLTFILGGKAVRGLLSRLHNQAAKAMDAAFAPRSRGSLASAIKAFARFSAACPHRELFKTPRSLGDRQASAWNEWTFVLFATYLSTTPSLKTKRPVSVNTIETYISLLKGYLSHSYAFELMERAPRLKRYLATLKEADPLAGIRRKRRALRRHHLKEMWKKIPKVRSNSSKAVNEFAMLTTAWHVLARGGEVAPSSFDPRFSPTRADLQFRISTRNIRYAIVWLRPIKKKGKPAKDKIPQFIQEYDGKGSDTYAALARLERFDPIPDEARSATPLFRKINSSGRHKSFTTSDLRNLIRLRIAQLGYRKPHQWGAHSCRIGGATDLASTGKASQLLLQAKGRWASDIGKIYARMTRRCQLAASRLMQQASGRDIEDIMPDFTQPI